MSPQRLIMLVFFMQALTFGSWLPRIPEVQEALGLDHATLAVGLMGLPVGTLLALPFAGRLATRFGSRMMIFVGFFSFLLAVTLPGWAASLPTLFGALLLTGATMSLLELGLNIKADEIEKQGSRLIMSTCHGFWSLGVMVGSLVGAGFAYLQIAPGMSQLIFAILVLPVSVLAAFRLPEPDTHENSNVSLPISGKLTLPHPVLLGICVFVLGIAMTEGAAADWSAVFLRDIFEVPPALSGFGYTLFALMITSGRFLGDRLKARFGAVNLGRTSALIGVAGCGLIVLSPTLTIALLGFAMLGIGASMGFPLAVTAAAEAPGASPARNVAVLSFFALAGFLAGPPVIGFIAHAMNLRFGLAMLLPALLVSSILASLLKARHRSAVHPIAAPII